VSTEEYFRAGVGLLVINDEGLVLALERTELPGSWQAPQGGLREGETPLKAAQRELSEETGIQWTDVRVLGEYPTWIGYELPPGVRNSKTARGQVHKWFLLQFTGSLQSINTEDAMDRPEFSSWQWMTIAQLIGVAWEVRQPVYQELAFHWSTTLHE